MTENRLGLIPVAPQFSESIAVSPRAFWGLLPHKMSRASESGGTRDPERTEREGGTGTGEAGRAPRLWLFTYWGPMATSGTRRPPRGHRNQNFRGIFQQPLRTFCRQAALFTLNPHMQVTTGALVTRCVFTRSLLPQPRTTQPPRPTQKPRLCKLPMAPATTDYSQVTYPRLHHHHVP